MKVILTEEVHGLGEPGKLVDVAPGYARNFLVPRKLAIYANTGNVRELEHHKQRLERKLQRLQVAAQSVAQRINGQTLTIPARAGEGGKLFGSVTTHDIAAALKAQFELEVDRRRIALAAPIRTLGQHSVEVRLLGDARATVTVDVVDNAPAPKPVAKPAPVILAPAEEEEEVAE